MFLSLFPAVVAAVRAYGLAADPAQIRSQSEGVAIGLAIAVAATVVATF